MSCISSIALATSPENLIKNLNISKLLSWTFILQSHKTPCVPRGWLSGCPPSCLPSTARQPCQTPGTRDNFTLLRIKHPWSPCWSPLPRTPWAVPFPPSIDWQRLSQNTLFQSRPSNLHQVISDQPTFSPSPHRGAWCTLWFSSVWCHPVGWLHGAQAPQRHLSCRFWVLNSSPPVWRLKALLTQARGRQTHVEGDAMISAL